MPQNAEKAVGARTNVIGVVMSLVFFVVASVGLTGNPWWLWEAGTKWIIAGAIALVGLGLLSSALPRKRPGKSRN